MTDTVRVILVVMLALVVGCASRELPGVEVEEGFSVAGLMQAYAAYEAEHGREVEGRHGRLHVLTWGESGMPLVWLHGTYSSSYEFAPTAERLVASGYRVIGIDCYGHGGTAKPDGALSIDHMADEVAAVMDELGIEQAVVGGWSRGGAIAASFYSHDPERVLGLVLLDGGSWSLQRFVDGLEPEALRNWMKGWYDEEGALATPVYSSKSQLVEVALERLEDSTLSAREKDLAYMAALARSEQLEDGSWTTFRWSVFHWLGQQNLASGYAGMTKATTADLFIWSTSNQVPPAIFRNLSVPMLIIDPTGDFMDMSPQNEELARQHPNWVVWRRYPDCGHDVLQQRPHAVFLAILDLLQRAEQ